VDIVLQENKSNDDSLNTNTTFPFSMMEGRREKKVAFFGANERKEKLFISLFLISISSFMSPSLHAVFRFLDEPKLIFKQLLTSFLL
jgi:hypothetical protein